MIEDQKTRPNGKSLQLFTVKFAEGSIINLENAAAITGIPLADIDEGYGLCVIDVVGREYVFQACVEDPNGFSDHGPYANPGIATFE